MKLKLVVVLAVLMAILSYMLGLGHPWWYGPVMSIGIVTIGVSIAKVLQWWIKK